MPNWCQNKLIIRAENLEEIVEEITTGESIDFEKIVPVPNDPAYHDKPNQAEAKESPNWWYNWNVENWGTKWNASEGYYDIHEKTTYYDAVAIFEFQTAWSPPEPIIHALAGKYPKALFMLGYREEGMGFEGVLIINQGNVECDVSRDALPEISRESVEWYDKPKEEE